MHEAKEVHFLQDYYGKMESGMKRCKILTILSPNQGFDADLSKAL